MSKGYTLESRRGGVYRHRYICKTCGKSGQWQREEDYAILWAEVHAETHEGCPACGAKPGEPCDPTALEDFDEEDE